MSRQKYRFIRKSLYHFNILLKIRDSPSAELSRALLVGKVLADINTFENGGQDLKTTLARKSDVFWNFKISELNKIHAGQLKEFLTHGLHRLTVC